MYSRQPTKHVTSVALDLVSVTRLVGRDWIYHRAHSYVLRGVLEALQGYDDVRGR